MYERSDFVKVEKNYRQSRCRLTSADVSVAGSGKVQVQGLYGLSGHMACALSAAGAAILDATIGYHSNDDIE